jgi:hypothetical protein
MNSSFEVCRRLTPVEPGKLGNPRLDSENSEYAMCSSAVCRRVSKPDFGRLLFNASSRGLGILNVARRVLIGVQCTFACVIR